MAATAARLANPYAAPRARVAEVPAQDAALGRFTASGRAVPAQRGWLWVKAGYALFRIQPALWTTLMFGWLLLSILVSSIPYVGPIIGGLLYPVMSAGLWLGCESADKGEGLQVRHLFGGFGEGAGRLVLLGLLHILPTLGLLVPIGLSLAILESLSGHAIGAYGVMILLGAVGLTPLNFLITTIIFSVPVARLNGLSPAAALRAGFSGSWRNWRPIVVCSLGMTLPLLVALLPLGVSAALSAWVGGVTGVTGITQAVGILISLAIGIVGLTVWVAVLSTTCYAAYRDIYYED